MLILSHKKSLIILSVSIGAFMSTLDASIVNISLPTIVISLNTTLPMVAWVVTGYLIIITGCLLLVGRVADLFGQKRTYILGFIVFTLGSVLCGISNNIYMLIGSRMIQGLGASSLMVNGTAIIATTFPETERGERLGMLGSVISAGFLTGPILGGFLIEHLGWRYIFFINLPIGILGTTISFKALNKDSIKGKVRLDVWGALLLFISISSLLLFFNQVGKALTPLSLVLLFMSLIFLGISISSLLLFFNQVGKALTPLSLVLLFMSLIFLGIFIAVEAISPFPLIDLSLLRKRLFISSLGAGLLSFSVGGAHNFVIPFFLQNVLGFSPSKVGMMVFPVSLTIMVMAPLGGKFSDKVGVRIPATLGLLLTSLTIFSFTYLNEDSRDFEILWRQIVLGIGIALFNPANNNAIISSLPRDKVGVASSFSALSRNLGLVMGVALAEMIISLHPLTHEKAVPTLESINQVWKIVLAIGLLAVFLSWVRGKKVN